jgi:glycosyltransferase involved in cell wall biosynthesis
MSILKNRNILLISPESWGECFVSKHHYAENLAERGNIVYFLNPPSKTKLRISSTYHPNIKQLDYPGFVKGFRYLPKFIKNNIFIYTLNQLQILCNARFEIVWSFDNSVFYNFDIFGNDVLKILHIVDYNQNFNIPIASQSADLCIGTTDAIVKLLKPHSKNLIKIGHALSSLVDQDSNKVIQFPGSNLIKAMYTGNLNIKYIDYTLLELVIQQNPEVDFIFAGPRGQSNLSNNKNVKDSFLRLEGYSNVFWLGVLLPKDIGSYLSSAHILFYAYTYQLYPEQLASPHKVLEYLASGNPIVATWTEEYSETNLLYMAKDHKDFLRTFAEIKNELGCIDDHKLRERRKGFARSNTYKNQIIKIEKYCVEHLLA